MAYNQMLLVILLLPVLGLMSVRRNLFHAFDSSHAHHENTKLSVHSEAQAHLTSTMGRKGGDWKKASELVDWHAPQPPWFSSDEEDDEHFDLDEAYALPVNHEVQAFYYPWYGAPDTDGKWIHWNHPRMPHWNKALAHGFPQDVHEPDKDDIGSDFYPQLGPYSSRDPHVLSRHMRQLRMAGVGTIVVSWLPPGLSDDNGDPLDPVWPPLLAAADDAGITVAPHMEPYTKRTAASVAKDIAEFHKRYKNSPALYKRPKDKRPVVYVYDSYRIPAKDWSAVFGPSGGSSIRGTAHDAFVIGLIVESGHVEDMVIGGFNGAYTYFAFHEQSYAANPRRWGTIADRLEESNILFVPSVGPGYVDVSVRPWNSGATVDRRDGKYYDEGWKEAMAVEAEIVSVTSFNEWHEGTQIEPAVPKHAEGRGDYRNYGKLPPEGYLKRTRVWAMRHKEAKARTHHAKREALLPRR